MMLKKIKIVINGIPRTNSINHVHRIRKIGIVEVRPRARSMPKGKEITIVNIAINKVSETPPMKKLPGTSTVEGVLIAVTSEQVTPETPIHPKL